MGLNETPIRVMQYLGAVHRSAVPVCKSLYLQYVER